ncbi:MAG: HpcH/HpaI aldolase family protein [Draconibacterium sp.]
MVKLKKRLKQGESLHGCWLNLGSTLTAEIIGNVGFDWVLIDLEHGSGNETDALLQLQAIKSTNTGAIIRVESIDKHRIQKALDIGAEGIMAPQARNISDVQIVLNAAYYAPEGERGVAKHIRATGFGHDFSIYKKQCKKNTLVIIQIETKEVLQDLDSVAALDGVDVLFIGPADLTMSLGIFGQYDHPIYEDALKKIIVAANKAGKTVGIYLFDPKDYRHYFDLGIRFFACGSDSDFVGRGAKEMANILNSNKA